MSDLTPDEEMAEVEEANSRFYRAVESLAITEMDRIWSRGDHVRCIHPGWGPLEGWEAVRQSWQAIFKDSPEMSFTLAHVQIRVGGDIAWVTCTENILSQVRGNIGVTTALATNVFEREGGDWLMVLHHASHILTGAPPGEA
ncbi:MAG: nuclear transport factor 2 family protein [Candidatus Rokubacteria bacterium]|nr:nuclear transport factor 2 family protein [Candidatus Rokubacteria bacterium]